MKLLKAVLAAAAFAWAFGASAQAYPTKVIRIVVPFPPGGSTDVIARKVGEKFQQSMGQPVIVDNKPGAGGAVGSAEVAKSAPDGYTLLVGVTGSHAVSVSLNTKLPYHPLKDFEPVSLLVSAPLTIVAHPSVPANDLRSLVALNRPLNHGSPGNGTSMHLSAEMFNLAAGTKFVHVPYKGTAAALNDLLGGQIQLMFGDFLITLPQVKAGKIKAFAVTSSQRHPLLPDVPTVAESGYPGFEALSWQGLFAPAGTPAEVVAKINAELVKALAAPDMKEYFAQQGFFVGGNSPAQFRAFIEQEIPKWARIIKAANVSID
ncbi:MAG TPA: tripartite tricarboxylate transporter substrate binding protein [Burkholderiales bacterium]|nr:tripartite tricarboxylate transporter substrate binding protein [Burkholderiales bacterium]